MHFSSRVISSACIAVCTLGILGCTRYDNPPEPRIPLPSSLMQIRSSAFKHNAAIPSKYTCDGGNTSPPLTVSDVPPEAQSLVLIVDDPDAPAGTWVHWTVWNIDPSVNGIPERSVPTGGVEGVTSFGSAGYGGPCPPSGTHRYFFKLYALKTQLDLPADAEKADIESAMQEYILAQAELIGLYERQ